MACSKIRCAIGAMHFQKRLFAQRQVIVPILTDLWCSHPIHTIPLWMVIASARLIVHRIRKVSMRFSVFCFTLIYANWPKNFNIFRVVCDILSKISLPLSPLSIILFSSTCMSHSCALILPAGSTCQHPPTQTQTSTICNVHIRHYEIGVLFALLSSCRQYISISWLSVSITPL